MTFNGYQENLTNWIKLWLQEDVGSGDITTAATVPTGHHSVAVIHAKQDGILAGLPVAEHVFQTVDPALQFTAIATEGQSLAQGDIIARVEGSTHSLLTGERLALNLLQRMSGIATRTRQYVDMIDGLPVRLVDTRKTTPGHRMLEKYAVRVGGGSNHRFGLYDAVMIKDNHIKAAGGILPAVQAARAQIPHTMTIEVETETIEQVTEALQSGADIIMLDNMNHELMREAVALIRSQSPHVRIEASGNVSLTTIRGLAETGIDIISVGRLTYSFDNLDISLDLGNKKRE
ncbi:carboxylating nicotinate-nucleotide diphosphorylase [Paenibacillus bovis]|uniref:Probable nicotinate-nucleotide pyrophosphorylase [carboxylating] n=1 Tax=Paenibacillus bovis TaxID=1616788 RepID=A0A172ZCZ0_9BACL|nr:carboxylating nicotinate-nucleotide diphosphorylase [Paenibacillus bovis]ANF95127.1 nicotinate-nucleotide diphosphorylase (carboxylating) [Paenibacillus bovis]